MQLVYKCSSIVLNSSSEIEQKGKDVTLLASLAAVGVVLLMAILYGFYEARNKWMKQQHKLKRGVEDFVVRSLW